MLKPHIYCRNCEENTISARYAFFKQLIVRVLRNLKVKYVNCYEFSTRHSHCKGTKIN